MAFLPSPLKGLTSTLWVQGRKDDYFYQVDGHRVRVSEESGGWQVVPETYAAKNLTVGVGSVYPDLPTAIAAGERDVHDRVTERSHIPHQSWKSQPASPRLRQSIQRDLKIQLNEPISRWEAQEFLNKHFEKVGHRKARRK